MIEDYTPEQTEDIARSWENGRMFRKSATAKPGEIRFRVLVIQRGKVIGDFFARQTEDDDVINSPVAAAFSMVGNRVSHEAVKQAGFERGQEVVYNTITHDLEIRLSTRGDNDDDDDETGDDE